MTTSQTNLGALTTTFTPPTSCPTGITALATANNFYIFQGATDTANCLPTNYVGALNHYYSPGIDCPSGYTPACSSTASAGDVTETAYTCCPTLVYIYFCVCVLVVAESSRHELTPSLVSLTTRWLSYGCQSTTSISYVWQSTLGCSIISDSDYPFTTSIEYVSGTESYATSRTFSGFGGINAYSVQIRFQASDLETSTTTTTSSASGSGSTTSTATPGTTASSTAAASSSSSTATFAHSGGGGGLSTGATAGIAVACVVAGILAVAAGFWYYRKRAQKKRDLAAKPTELPRPDKPELSGWGNEMNPVEAPSKDNPAYARAELPNHFNGAAELDNHWAPPAEMDDGRQHYAHELP